MAVNKLLIVEDEPDICDMLDFTLSRAGFVVDATSTAEDALRRLFESDPPALIIIDWMLPGMQGVNLAKRLRAEPATCETPLIMLTARGEETDKLEGFDAGFDDYVTKPFSPKELIARIKALLRRAGLPTDNQLHAGALTLDLRAHDLRIGGDLVPLGPTEFRLLEFLLSHPGRAFSRSQLLDQVWGRSAYVEERTVDVHILRLRRVLKMHAQDKAIETVRGVGYRFSAASVAPEAPSSSGVHRQQ